MFLGSAATSEHGRGWGQSDAPAAPQLPGLSSGRPQATPSQHRGHAAVSQPVLHVAGGCWSCASQPELAGLAGPGVSCRATAGCARLLRSEHCLDQTSSVAVLAPLLQIVGTAVIDSTWAFDIKKASPLFADCSVLSCVSLGCTTGVPRAADSTRELQRAPPVFYRDVNLKQVLH